MMSSRTSLKGIKLVNWGRFQNGEVRIKDSVYISGQNGIGKSQIIDALLYQFTGSTRFNAAAKKLDVGQRTIGNYILGNSLEEGKEPLRTPPAVGYILTEWEDPIRNTNVVIGTYIYVDAARTHDASWFIVHGAEIKDVDCVEIRDGRFIPKTKKELKVKGKKLDLGEDFYKREKGIKNVMRALQITGSPMDYRHSMENMNAFDASSVYGIEPFIRNNIVLEKEIKSLEQLRKMRNALAEIRLNIKECDAKVKDIDEIIKKQEQYEKERERVNVSKAIIPYQQVKMFEKENTKNKGELKEREWECKKLDGEITSLGQQIAEKEEYIRTLYQNEELLDLNRMTADLKNQVERNRTKERDAAEKIEKIIGFQEAVKEYIAEDRDGISLTAEEECTLDCLGKDAKKSIALYETLKNERDRRYEVFLKKEAERTEEKKDLEEKQKELYKEKKELENKKIVVPRKYKEALDELKQMLEKEGIDNANPKFLYQGIRAVKDEAWQDAVEALIGIDRFLICVKKNHREAEKIAFSSGLDNIRLLMDHKINEKRDPEEGSVAALLDIPDEGVKKYITLRFGRTHCCGSIDELDEYPKGGLTADRVSTKNYTMKRLRKVAPVIGERAVEKRLADVTEELEQIALRLSALDKELEDIKRLKSRLNRISFDLPSAWTAAYSDKETAEENIKRTEEKIEELGKDPNIIKLRSEIEKETEEKKYLSDKLGECQKKKGEAESDIRAITHDIEANEEKIRISENYLSEFTAANMVDLDAVKKRYNELIEIKKKKEPDATKALEDRTVQKDETTLANTEKDITNLQAMYIASNNVKGVAAGGKEAFGWFNKERTELAQYKMEELTAKEKEASEKIKDAFSKDYISEISGNIDELMIMFSDINKKLKENSFKNDMYQFVVKPDRKDDLKNAIWELIEQYREKASHNLPLEQASFAEEFNTKLEDVMKHILTSKDGKDDLTTEKYYSDYRNLLQFDLVVKEHDGNNVKRSLTKTGGTGSGAEVQIPYFIMMLASTMRFFPEDKLGARVILIDESFATMDESNKENMFRYMQGIGIQPILAGPQKGAISELATTNLTVVRNVNNPRTSSIHYEIDKDMKRN